MKKHEHLWFRVWTDGVRFIFRCRWCGEMGYGVPL